MGLFRKKAAGPVDYVALSTRGQRWGQPGSCPMCGTGGFLDRVDLVDREIYQHCPRCEHQWVTHEEDLEAVSR